MSLEILNLMLVTLKPSQHVRGNIVQVKGSITHSKDFLTTVLTRNDNKTVLSIKDIEYRNRHIGRVINGAFRNESYVLGRHQFA